MFVRLSGNRMLDVATVVAFVPKDHPWAKPPMVQVQGPMNSYGITHMIMQVDPDSVFEAPKEDHVIVAILGGDHPVGNIWPSIPLTEQDYELVTQVIDGTEGIR